jgi:hypothetical protein
MNEQLQKLIAMLQGQTNSAIGGVGNTIEDLYRTGDSMMGKLGPAGKNIGGKISGLGQKIATEGVTKMNPMLATLGNAGVNAGNFVGSNPGMALGGAALGGLNLAGLGDGEDILMQLLAGAGGAGLGYAKGGIPGAVMGGLGGGAAGDMLPKLVRMLQGQ